MISKRMKLCHRFKLLTFTIFVLGAFIFTILFYELPSARAQVAPDENSPALLLNHSTAVTHGEMHILGNIKNIDDEPLNFVKVLASFYDQGNKFLGSEFNYADPVTDWFKCGVSF